MTNENLDFLAQPTTAGKFAEGVTNETPSDLDISPFTVEQILSELGLVDPNTQKPTKLAKDKDVLHDEKLLELIGNAADAWEKAMIVYSATAKIQAAIEMADLPEYKQRIYSSAADTQDFRGKRAIGAYKLFLTEALKRL